MEFSLFVPRDALMNYMIASLPAFSSQDISNILIHLDYLVDKALIKSRDDPVFIEYLRTNPVQALVCAGSPYPKKMLQDVMKARLEYVTMITTRSNYNKSEIVRYISQRLPAYSADDIRYILEMRDKALADLYAVVGEKRKHTLYNPVELLALSNVPFSRGMIKDVLNMESDYIRSKKTS